MTGYDARSRRKGSRVAVVRTLVVDDHPLFARGLELLLPQASDGRVTVVGWTADARMAGSDARPVCLICNKPF